MTEVTARLEAFVERHENEAQRQLTLCDFGALDQ
jgi:hypothetical protein